MGSDDTADYRAPGWFVDSDHPDVVAYAEKAVGDAESDADRAKRLFRTVRDGLRYDPYSVSGRREDYKASAILLRDRAYCTPKAILLAASLRALEIPAKLGFADVKNHLSSDKLTRTLGTDLFVYHGYVELLIDGRWIKVTPAFNAELCARFGVAPLEFDGVNEAMLQAADGDGRKFMEYVHDHGTFADLPFEAMMEGFRAAYGWDRLGEGARNDRPEDEAFGG